MIQRIQTVYLLLASIICIAFLFFPIAKTDAESIIPNENTITAALFIASSLLSFVSMLNYKNRLLQVRVCFITIALLFVAIANMYYATTKLDDTHTLTLFFATPILIVLLLFLAIRSIRKDEALVKSMDRFR